MKDKLRSFFDTCRHFYRKQTKKQKRIYFIVGIILLIAILLLVKKQQNRPEDIITIAPQVLSRTVRTTGTLTSETDLSLGFENAGTIKSTPVSVGKKVKAGTVLATLSAGAENADVTKARGNLLKAEAEYNKAIKVTQGDSIANKELELVNAKREQDLLVHNAYDTLLSNDLVAFPVEERDEVAPTISGSYHCKEEGKYTIELYLSGTDSGSSFTYTGLEEGVGAVYTTRSENIGTCGLYITFPEGFSLSTDWEITIPNTRSSTYGYYKNLYDLAQNTRTKTISQLESELALLKAQIETGDTKIAYANLVSAQGELQSAQARLENTIIRAPSSGVVTKITKKPGESVSMREEVIVLQDIEHLYVQSAVNESNIVGIKPGQSVTITFDALTEDQIFTGTVSDIDIAPTNSGNVTNYTITAVVDTIDPILRPGMTANMTIQLFKDETAIAIPRRALIAKDEGWYVNVLDEKDNKKEVQVTLGRDADGGLVEILSGLNEHDVVWIETQQ